MASLSEHRKQQKREAMQRYYQKHSDKIKEYNKLRYVKNRDSILEQVKDYYAANRDKVRTSQKEYYSNNKQGIIERNKKRLQTDLQFKLRDSIRRRVKRQMKLNSKNLHEYLGCNYLEFKQYLQAKFQPGMTWHNYGQWHIDHKLPLSWFDLTRWDHCHLVLHYTNLQPLWAEDNLRKGNRYGNII